MTSAPTSFVLPSLMAALALLPAYAESHGHEGEHHHHHHHAQKGHVHADCHEPVQKEHLEDSQQEHSHAPFDHLCAHSWDFELGGYASNTAMQEWVNDGLRHVHFDHEPTADSVSKLCWVEGARILAMGEREKARVWLQMSREDEAMINLACLEYEAGNVDVALRLMDGMMHMNDEQGVMPPVSAVLSLPMLRYASGSISREELEKAAADHAKGPGAWVHDYVNIPWILENIVRSPEDALNIRARLEAAADAGQPEAEVALIALAEMRIMIVGQRPGWEARLAALAPNCPRADKMQKRVEMLRWVLNECLPTLMPKSSR